MTSDFEQAPYRLARASSTLGKRLADLERKDNAIYEVKATTGDPTPRGNFHFVINIFDNTLRVYADGDWRELASW